MSTIRDARETKELVQPGLDVTEVRVHIVNQGRLKAFSTLTFGDAFAVRGIKVIEGKDRLFVAMPAKRAPSGEYQDVCHPISRGARKRIEELILGEYVRLRDNGLTSTDGEPEESLELD